MLTWTTTGRQPLRAYLLKTLNPPFLGALAGLALKALSLGTGIAVPATLLNVAKLMGDATVPLAMIVLGGLLAEAKWSTHFEFKAVAAISIVKLGIVPLLALLILRNFRMPYSVLSFFCRRRCLPPRTSRLWPVDSEAIPTLLPWRLSVPT
jgi:predicted permease